jgi:RHS repeat-associated protein
MTQPLRPSLRIVGLLLLVLAGVLTGTAHADMITYFHNDPSGSPVAATDESGRLLWKESYRPYGERLLNGASSDANRLWFTGKPQDPDTGLSYLGARYYSPQLGRFMGIDPKAVDPGDPHSFNRYAYANNNPYKFVDPDGRSPAAAVLFVIANMAAGAVLGGGMNAAIQYHETGEVRWSGVGGVLDAAGDGAMFGLLGGGAALATRTVVVAETTTAITAAKGAEAAADAARAAGRTSGAAAELRVGDHVYTDVSTGGAPRTLHPDVQAVLDEVPQSQRAPWHGHCAEPGCVSQALSDGVNPAGGTSRAVNIGESGKGHGTPKPTCSSCRYMLDQFEVKHD